MKPNQKVIFRSILEEEKLPQPIEEHQFHDTRKWRTDYCWPDHNLVLEVEGKVWGGGRHTNPAGFLKDMEKYNELACMGFRLIRCVPRDLCHRRTIALIRRALYL